MTLHLTPQRIYLLHLLTVTMVSAPMLVDGGIFYSKTGKKKNSLRNAQRMLQKLEATGYIGFFEYSPNKNGRPRRFFYPKKETLQLLKKEQWQYLKISEGLVRHDSITALFLVHLFRCAQKRGFSIRCYKAPEMGDKKADALIAIFGKTTYAILLETDTGTHDHTEIREKISVYCRYFLRKRSRMVFFLVNGEQRKQNLKQTAGKVLQNIGQYHNKIFFFCPQKFKATENIFATCETA